MTRLIPLAILLLWLSACVSNKKYEQVQYLQEQGAQRERQLHAQLDFARAQIEDFQRQIGTLNQQVGDLNNDKRELEADTAQLQSRIRDMSRRARSTQEELRAELEGKTQELDEKRRRLQEIDQTVERRDSRLKEAFAAMQDTLRSLGSADARVEFGGGRLVVSLSDQLLFGGKTAALTPAGEKALARVSTVLTRYPDLDVLALGHTSNDRPARGFDDNWELSARRAAQVVRLLTGRYNVNSSQLTAAGKGEYQPLAANDSPENKQRNRRIELILAPRTELLYNLLNKNTQ